MAGTIHRLKALAVAQNTTPGLYSDGGGLYLQIMKAGAKSWLFRYMRQSKARSVGLGPLHTVSLAQARLAAHACRGQLQEGVDPLAAKKDRQHAQRMDDARALSFRDCATQYHLSHKDAWKNKKHADQWTNTLSTYAYPTFGHLPIADVDVELVMKVLEPIWKVKTETASRLRGRIESVIDWATARGYRRGDNPARWKGHLDHLLISRSAANKVAHHPALPYGQLPQFISALRDEVGISPLALEFTILCASRTSETIKATFAEFDLEAKVWVIPPARMKADREHRVPLSDRACAIVERMANSAENDFVFPGRKKDSSLTNMAMLELVRGMKFGPITVHGFRSTFRDWAGECTHHPRECIEFALAHTVKDKTEAAYFRGDLFEKRRLLMNDWAAFCQSQ
ncbi:integrase [Massilia eurypsychrophila]|uniref:Integrase n=1 Tax=Massilia eurypsychrophila TaxID=1485217 RepID=A0A2G8T7Y8_9BURK|nr:integrase arm-type DNA-binding domain-containing protein [Massilia eurypsychrophila]PIL42177.1 integrase [Massilia eurypsychrophila]